jgi:leader peptidase (prepilin peptidase)/N-methyltransferase
MGVEVGVAALLGGWVGVLADRAAGRFPWPKETPARRLWRDNVRPGASAVHPAVLAVVTAVLFGLAALRFGAAPELAAYLVASGAGVLLAVVDLQHRLLPNRVVLPAIAAVAVLLGVAAAVDGTAAPLVRALIGGVVLFLAFFVLAFISPASLGMGDVKLAALLGLLLGWVGWPAVLLGALAGFVLQAVLSLGLLAARRIGLQGHLPFGPAMLAGAAVVVALPGLLAGGLSAL